MALRPPSIRHWNRYRLITGVFLRHGFEFAFNQVEPDWRALRLALRLPARRERSSPPEELASHFRLALEESGLTFIKFGQILSTRPDLLPPTYIAELSKLQDTIPPATWETIREVLIRELGHEPEEVFKKIDPQPLAAASLAQVHAATLQDGREVVVKVQRPGITPMIATDLEILSSLAARAQTTPLGKIYNFIEMAENFSFTLKNELDYRREGRNAERFRKNFSAESHLYIPQVHWEFSSQRVLVLERIYGVKIGDIVALEAAGYDRHRVALRCARIIIKEVLEDGFFHADPHPGNYNVLTNEVIGAMDFGMVGYLKERDRLDLIRIYIVALAMDTDGIVDQLVRIRAADSSVDRSGLSRDIGRLLNKYFSLPLKDVRVQDVVGEFMPLAFRYHLRLPADYWLLGKTLSMMEGIGVQLDPDFDIFEVAKPYIKKMEWHLLRPDSGWKRAVLLGGAQWGEMISRLPHVGSRILDHIEHDEPIQFHLDETDRIMNKLDRLVTRLALSILTGSLIIGLAFLIPNTPPSGWLRWITSLGLGVSIIMGLWLFISLIRSKY